jgi:hypothetical protein
MMLYLQIAAYNACRVAISAIHGNGIIRKIFDFHLLLYCLANLRMQIRLEATREQLLIDCSRVASNHRPWILAPF